MPLCRSTVGLMTAEVVVVAQESDAAAITVLGTAVGSGHSAAVILAT